MNQVIETDPQRFRHKGGSHSCDMNEARGNPRKTVVKNQLATGRHC
jgi:hypothetical protein